MKHLIKGREKMNIKSVKVESMVSKKSGKAVANQFKIFTSQGVYFQSYNTIIAYKDKTGQIYLDSENWNYSKTTSKYRNMFTRLSTDETKKAIEQGKIKLVELN